jgi:hypothetical protein
MSENPVDVAIQSAGSQQMLATFLGVSRPTVSYWKKQREIPMEWIERVQHVTQMPFYLLLSEQQKKLFHKVQAQEAIKAEAMKGGENGKV